MGRVTKRTPAVRLDLSDPDAPLVVTRPDTVTVEEPLEIRVGRDLVRGDDAHPR